MKGLRRQWLLVSAASGVASLLCGSALAQVEVGRDEGPIIIGQRQQHDRFYLAPGQFTLDVVAAYQNSREKSEGQQEVESRQTVLSEQLSAQTFGHIIHPNFIWLDLGGSFGLSQQFTDTGGESDASYGTIYDWDTRATLLRRSKSPLTVYSRREQDWTFREFGPAIETTTTDTGANLGYHTAESDSNFSLSHLTSDQTGLEDTEDLNYTRDSFAWSTAWRPSLGHTVTWNYNYASIDQSGIFDTSFQTHDATLGHEWLFGPRRENSLRSTLDYSRQMGSADYEQLGLSERLNLRHSKDLRSRFSYDIDRFDINGSERINQRAAAGFTHELYKSLTTDGNVSVHRTDEGSGASSTGINGDLGWEYRKQVPYGLLTADLGFGLGHVENDAIGEGTPFLDRPATFTDPLPIVITGTNIDPNSIVITDPSGLLIYEPGVDYTVTAFPDFVQIDRVVGGRIGSGDTVLLDYTVGPQGANSIDTSSFHSGLRYDIREGWLKGLGVFGRYSRLDQNIDSDGPNQFVPNTFDDWRYGADYRFWDFLLSAERQIHDSVIVPFEATRYRAQWQRRISLEATASLNATYTNIEYPETDNETDLTLVSAQWRQQLARNFEAVLTGAWRYEEDRLAGTTEGFEQQLEVRWRHRQTQVFLLVRNAMLDTEGQDNSYQLFQIGVRREF